jgi:hypothetical protein
MAIQYEFPSLVPRRVLETPAPPRPEESVLSRAETAECTCPDFCERDHDRD